MRIAPLVLDIVQIYFFVASRDNEELVTVVPKVCTKEARRAGGDQLTLLLMRPE